MESNDHVTSDSDLDLVDPGVGRGHMEVTGSRRQQQREQALRRSELKIDLDLRDSLPTCDDVTAALRHADVSDSLTFDYIAANDTRHCVGTVRLPDDLRDELRLDLRRSSSESSATDDNSFPPPAPASATDEEDEDDDDDDDVESSAASQSAASDGQSTPAPQQLQQQQQREDGDDPVTETTASRHQRRVEDAGDDPVPDGDLVFDIDAQDADTRHVHVDDAGEVDRRQSDLSRSQSLRSQQQVIGDDHATAAAARPTTTANHRAQSSHGAYRTSIARCAGVAMSSAELLRPAPSNHRPQTAAICVAQRASTAAAASRSVHHLLPTKNCADTIGTVPVPEAGHFMC